MTSHGDACDLIVLLANSSESKREYFQFLESSLMAAYVGCMDQVGLTELGVSDKEMATRASEWSRGFLTLANERIQKNHIRAGCGRTIDMEVGPV